MKNKKVVLLENIHPAAEENLRKAGFRDIVAYKDSPVPDELVELVREAGFIGLRSRTKLTKELLREAKNLSAIGCFCIGTEQVDCQAAKELGIPVFNAPFSNTRSVAELVIGETIALMRKLPQKNKKCHDGIWDKNASGCFEIKGKTIGIVGYGHIGMQVGLMAESLNMNVIYYDIEKKLTLGSAKTANNLEELLAVADVVSLHIPGNADTQNLMTKKEFTLMKKGALFLNNARGKLVDIDALADVLESGHLAGAAVDVFPTEPKGKDEEFLSKLRAFDNVILTPHIGGSTEEAQLNIALDVVDKFIGFGEAGNTYLAVNFPEINLKPDPTKTRLVHIHKNVAGVMRDLNKVFGEANINITGQYLQTDSYLGYVITDIDKSSLKPDIVEKLQAVANTIKVIKV